MLVIKSNVAKEQKNSIQLRTSFEGPIPPPNILEAYRKIIPNAPERILKMAEKNSDYLMEFDKNKLQLENDQIKRGQWCALIVVLSICFLCAYALYLNYPTVAIILGGLDLVGLVLAFIASTLHYKQQNKS